MAYRPMPLKFAHMQAVCIVREVTERSTLRGHAPIFELLEWAGFDMKEVFKQSAPTGAYFKGKPEKHARWGKGKHARGKQARAQRMSAGKK